MPGLKTRKLNYRYRDNLQIREFEKMQYSCIKSPGQYLEEAVAGRC